ncbi:hypothetical protein [Candidatus Poriferisodalis sp.]|uniref:hypothetical protein n=1 Tax=Candidatus Poriferisodalis sp. TaxID=3101277 RepID=UPI003B028497
MSIFTTAAGRSISVGVGKPVKGAVNCGAAAVVAVAGSVTATDVTGAAVVGGAVPTGGAAVVGGVTFGADVAVGAGSTSVVSGGTVMDEQADSNISTASHVAQISGRRVLLAAILVRRHLLTAPWRPSANGSRTCSKGLLLDIRSRATAAIRPNIHHTGRLSREGGTLPT